MFRKNNNEKKCKHILYRRNAILCGVVILMLSLAGCGNGKNSKESTKKDQTATNTDAMQPFEESNVTQIQPQNSATLDESGFYAVNDYVKTVGDTINVRVQPSTDAGIYEMLVADQVLQRTGYNDQWTRVKIDGTNFYIFSEFVTETEAPQTTETTEAGAETEGEENKVEKPKTIVIDPGNQASMNAATEQLGPGSEETKIGVTEGVSGTQPGSAEYALNMSYALALREELINRGFEVTLTRESNDANITNKQRAEIANATGATAFVRIKMNYSTNSALTGVMAEVMTADSPYNSELYEESHKLATRILQGITEETQAVNHGIYETTGMTAINWSNIPVAVVELGYLSNEQDEANLLNIEYQKKLVSGIADGIELYYGN